jgi:hypothetical protein
MQLLRVMVFVAALFVSVAIAAEGEEPDRLHFPGFSLVPPKGNRWTATTETPYPSIQAFFGRDISKERKSLG